MTIQALCQKIKTRSAILIQQAGNKNIQKYQRQVRGLINELWQQKPNDIDFKLINEIVDVPIKHETEHEKVLATEDSRMELVEFENNKKFREYQKFQAKQLFY